MVPHAPEARILQAHGMSIVVQVYPDEDQLWNDLRRTALAVLVDTTDEAGLRRAVERGMHAWYPRIAIVRKQSFASLAEECVWYVLRDGRVTRPHEKIDRLFHALSDARDTKALSDDVMDRAQATMEEASRPRAASRRSR